MALNYLSNIDLNNNELFNARIQNVATLPTTAYNGKVIWNTNTKKYYIGDGTNWLILATEGYVGTSVQDVIDALDLHKGKTTATDDVHGSKTYVDQEITTLDTALSGDISTVSGNLTTHENAANPHSESESTTNKGVANGYAPLNVDTLIPNEYLPEQARMKLYIVDTIAERDTLATNWGTAETGNKVIVMDEGDVGNTYIWDGTAFQLQSADIWGDVNIDWANLLNKPTSTVTAIDNAVTFTQGSDSFSTTGDYTNLRARATTATDVGLGNVGNYSRADYDARYLVEANNLSDLASVPTAITNLGLDNVADRFTNLIGDGVTTDYVFASPFTDKNIDDVIIQVIENGANYANVFPEIQRNPTTDEVTISFSTAPATDAYKVLMIG